MQTQLIGAGCRASNGGRHERHIHQIHGTQHLLRWLCVLHLLFLTLTFDTHSAWPERDNQGAFTPQVALGKKVWEKNNCIGCYTPLGEGA